MPLGILQSSGWRLNRDAFIRLQFSKVLLIESRRDDLRCFFQMIGIKIGRSGTADLCHRRSICSEYWTSTRLGFKDGPTKAFLQRWEYQAGSKRICSPQIFDSERLKYKQTTSFNPWEAMNSIRELSTIVRSLLVDARGSGSSDLSRQNICSTQVCFCTKLVLHMEKKAFSQQHCTDQVAVKRDRDPSARIRIAQA